MCSYGGSAQLPRSRFLQTRSRRDENFPIWTLQPITVKNLFSVEKIASLSQLGGQNGIILPCMYFHFRSMRICFISKVASVDKATIVANDATVCVAFLVSSLEFHPGQSVWNFPYVHTTARLQGSHEQDPKSCHKVELSSEYLDFPFFSLHDSHVAGYHVPLEVWQGSLMQVMFPRKRACGWTLAKGVARDWFLIWTSEG